MTSGNRNMALVLSLLTFLLPGANPPAHASFPASDNFVLTLDTNLGSNRFILPFSEAGGFNVSVDWGDGTFSNSATVNPDHSYVAEGIYTVTVTNNGSNLLRFGSFMDVLDQDTYLSFNLILTEVNSFPSWIDSYAEAFFGASNLTAVPTSIPAGVVTNMSSMFFDASKFNSDISGWDTSAVTNMSSMFNRATIFNADVSSWDTSAVTNMSSMFSFATDFDAHLSGWNTGAVTSMESMFEVASSFSSDISGWDTSNATNFGNMFRSAESFNFNLDSWDTSKVTNMYQMFSGISAMEYCLPSWNLSTRTGTNMTGMFSSEYSNAGCVEVIFDPEGGSAVPSFSYKAVYPLPAPYTSSAKANANFLGWASEPDGGSISFPVLVTIIDPLIDPSASSIITFFAVWESTLPAPPPEPSQSVPGSIPAVYTGPVFSEFSNRFVRLGDSVQIYGQRLGSINFISIDGIRVEISSKSDKALAIQISQGIKPGTKDLIVNGDFGKLTVLGALTILEEAARSGPESTSGKLTAGLLNGSVAIYAKGYEGRTLSWKIAGKWVKTVVTSNYQVFFRKTREVGRTVLVGLYLDGENQLTTSLITK
jgi:surface protein